MSRYPNHYQLKKNRLKKLKQVGGKCEVCGESAHRVIRKDNTKYNHSVKNLKALCGKCFYARSKGRHNKSRYRQIYGMTLKEMSKKFGYGKSFYSLLNRKGLLKKHLERITIKK